MYYDQNREQFTLVVTIRIRVSGKMQNMPCAFYYDVEREGEDVIGFKYNGEMDNFSTRYVQTFDKLLDVANALASVKYKISTPSLLAPVNVTLTDTSNESNYIAIEASRR